MESGVLSESVMHQNEFKIQEILMPVLKSEFEIHSVGMFNIKVKYYKP